MPPHGFCFYAFVFIQGKNFQNKGMGRAVHKKGISGICLPTDVVRLYFLAFKSRVVHHPLPEEHPPGLQC